LSGLLEVGFCFLQQGVVLHLYQHLGQATMQNSVFGRVVQPPPENVGRFLQAAFTVDQHPIAFVEASHGREMFDGPFINKPGAVKLAQRLFHPRIGLEEIAFGRAGNGFFKQLAGPVVFQFCRVNF